MISPARVYDYFHDQGIAFYTGVPDSLLKNFLKYLQDHAAQEEHIITANEGLAIGLASGYYFQTGRLPLVYLQNSGLGNIINPLTSLADKEMYGVPMLLLIGWRGKPGTTDEPQHKKMGRITVPLLDILEVPVHIPGDDEASFFTKAGAAIEEAKREQKPVALLVQGAIFQNYEGLQDTNIYSMNRDEVIGKILESLSGNETVLCTTGKIGRSFYEQNEQAGGKIKKYLLSVGAMGHANHIALGMHLQSAQKTIMLDGDGAILMQMGSLPVIGRYAANNYVHIVLNNGSHESVGAQPTQGFSTDLCAVAAACGYKQIIRVSTEKELMEWLTGGLRHTDTQFVEIRINNSSRKSPGRPKGDPQEWKASLQRAINK